MKLFLLGMITTYIITGIVLELDYKLGDSFDKNEWILYAYCLWIWILEWVFQMLYWLFSPFIHFRLALYLIRWKYNPWGVNFRKLKEMPYEARVGIIKYVPKKNKNRMREALGVMPTNGNSNAADD